MSMTIPNHRNFDTYINKNNFERQKKKKKKKE